VKARAAPAQPVTTDPLFLLPSRYEDRTHLTPIGALLNGTRAVVEGEVQLADVVYRRRRSLLVWLGLPQPAFLLFLPRTTGRPCAWRAAALHR
jgi:hypothetical protein